MWLLAGDMRLLLLLLGLLLLGRSLRRVHVHVLHRWVELSDDQRRRAQAR
jgi:hypothetical protein